MSNENLPMNHRILHITLRKCGSQWVRDVLRAPELHPYNTYLYSGITKDLSYENLPIINKGTLSGPIYNMNAREWQNWNCKKHDLAIVIIRDPRDRIVSDLHSALFSHTPTPRTEAVKKFLTNLKSNSDQLNSLITFNAHSKFYQTWASSEDSSSLVVKYENLILHPYEEFSKIANWLNLSIPAPILRSVINRLSFKAKSGRMPGATDIYSHYRRGVSGDWVNFFTHSHGQLFESLYPGLLQKLGYESQSDWWCYLKQDLKAQSNNNTSLNADSASENQIKTLAKENEEKEAVIQAQGKSLLEKEDGIQTLHKSISEKEDVIQTLHKSISEKEDVIQTLHKSISEKNKLISALRITPTSESRFFIKGKLKEYVKPNIGVLNHYPPKTLRTIRDFSPKTISPTQLRISVVTPSFNHDKYIIKTVNSVLNQQYEDLEFYIQDGASNDKTVEKLKLVKSTNFKFASAPDHGQADAINKAFAKTSGDIMAWINSDDILLPGALNFIAHQFAKHPEIDVIYGNRILIDEHDKEIGYWILPKHNDEVLSWVDYIPQETLFWRRSIWEKTGASLDDTFQFAMDWDLLVRFRATGAKFKHVDRFLGCFRVHTEQKTSKDIEITGNNEMNRIRKRCLGYVPTNTEIRRATFIYLARHKLKHLWYKFTNQVTKNN